jgi:hypothetical protein
MLKRGAAIISASATPAVRHPPPFALRKRCFALGAGGFRGGSGFGSVSKSRQLSLQPHGQPSSQRDD